VAAAEDATAGLGYRRFEVGMPGRLFYYRDEDGQRANQLHVVPADTWDARNERLLRDHLRAHPDDARRYAELKQRLGGEHRRDRVHQGQDRADPGADRPRPGRSRAPPGPRLGRMSYRADQPPSSRYEEPLANDAGAEQR
jgi:hypothetical protein